MWWREIQFWRLLCSEVAKELHEQGSPVRLAKIDADEHSSVKGTYGVQGFPTLYFFLNGQKMKYEGQRSKEFMVNWLSKKTRDPIIAIEADKIESLSDGKVNVVFHGDISSSEGSAFAAIAAADDYNSTNSLTQLTTTSRNRAKLRVPFR